MRRKIEIPLICGFQSGSVVGIKAVHLDFRIVFRLINDSAGFTKLVERQVTPFDSTARLFSTGDGNPGSNQILPLPQLTT
jgi:hypothetical protein